MEDFESVTELVPEPRLVLIGPVGSGKSSFINSVNSTLRERYEDLAFTDEKRKESVTKIVSEYYYMYFTHKIVYKNSIYCHIA